MEELELKRGINLAITGYKKFQDYQISLIKKLALENKRIIYVVTNFPSKHIMSLLKKQDIPINNIIFLDTLTPLLENNYSDEDEDNVFYAGIKDLEAINLRILKIIRDNPSFSTLFIDSPSTIIMNNDIETSEKFFQRIFAQMEDLNINVLLYSLKEDYDSKHNMFLSKFIDNIITLK